jgi:endo-1,4-beta-xylanase
MKRRTFLAGTAAALAAAPLWPRLSKADAATLRAAAAAKGIVFGANFRDLDLLTGYSDFANLTTQQCALIEGGRQFQWANLRPSPTSFDFHKADEWVSWAQSHGLLVAECHLMWHMATGKWVRGYVNSGNVNDVIENHVRTVVGHYAGKMYSWVVANEMINPKEGLPNGMRNSFWWQAGGQDAIDNAFKTAAAADPKAILLYNDYGVEEDGGGSAEKRRITLDFLSGMLHRGVPIHAYGIQAHLSGKRSGFNSPGFSSFLNDVSNLGLKILITELDVGDDTLPTDEGTRDAAAAKIYGDFLKTALANKNVTTVITWSLSDKYNWRNEWQPGGRSHRPDGTPSRGMPFGANLEPTPIVSAMLDAFQSAPSR